MPTANAVVVNTGNHMQPPEVQHGKQFVQHPHPKPTVGFRHRALNDRGNHGRRQVFDIAFRKAQTHRPQGTISGLAKQWLKSKTQPGNIMGFLATRIHHRQTLHKIVWRDVLQQHPHMTVRQTPKRSRFPSGFTIT
jgi:hypothetical protein